MRRHQTPRMYVALALAATVLSFSSGLPSLTDVASRTVLSTRFAAALSCLDAHGVHVPLHAGHAIPPAPVPSPPAAWFSHGAVTALSAAVSSLWRGTTTGATPDAPLVAPADALIELGALASLGHAPSLALLAQLRLFGPRATLPVSSFPCPLVVEVPPPSIDLGEPVSCAQPHLSEPHPDGAPEFIAVRLDTHSGAVAALAVAVCLAQHELEGVAAHAEVLQSVDQGAPIPPDFQTSPLRHLATATDGRAAAVVSADGDASPFPYGGEPPPPPPPSLQPPRLYRTAAGDRSRPHANYDGGSLGVHLHTSVSLLWSDEIIAFEEGLTMLALLHLSGAGGSSTDAPQTGVPPQYPYLTTAIFPSNDAALDVLDVLAKRGLPMAKVAMAWRWAHGKQVGNSARHHPSESGDGDPWCAVAVEHLMSVVEDATAGSFDAASHGENSFPSLWESHEDAAVLRYAAEDAVNIDALRARADEGDPGAQLQMGELLQFGYPIAALRADPAAAEGYFRAAAQGAAAGGGPAGGGGFGGFVGGYPEARVVPMAQAQLGLAILDQGGSNATRVAEAKTLLEAAAAANDSHALAGLGWMAEVGGAGG